VPIGVSSRVTGVNETITALANIDPAVRKALRAEARQITKPIIDDAKKRYPVTTKGQSPLRGINYNWQAVGGSGFPYDVRAARRGLRFFADIAQKNRTVIRVRQINAAAALIEYVGSRTNNGLGEAVAGRYGTRNRFLWAAAESRVPQVRDEVRQAIARFVRDYDRRGMRTRGRL